MPFRSRGPSWLGALLVAATAYAASAQTPTKIPLGNHRHNFLGNGFTVLSSGWDPAYDASDQSAKTAIINALAANGVTTYPVGLPSGNRPDTPGVYRPWSSTGISNPITAAQLEAAEFPTVTLEGVAGPVYLIHHYTSCYGSSADGCAALKFGAGKFVLANVAVGALEAASGGGPEIWIVDSLVDGAPTAPAGYRFPDSSASHIMYSEILGGDDACKIHSNADLYRSHYHGVSHGPGSTDGCQAGSAKNVFIIETTVDHYYGQDNAVYWLPSEFGDAGPVYAYRNFVIGGHNGFRIVDKSSDPAKNGNWVGAFVAKDNLSGAIATRSSHSQGFFADPTGSDCCITKRGGGNRKVDGGAAGPASDFPDGLPTTADDQAVAKKVAQLDKWVSQIRAAAGVPNPTIPSPPSPSLSAPVLLD